MQFCGFVTPKSGLQMPYIPKNKAVCDQLCQENELMLFVPSLSYCNKKAMVALYFGQIRTRLGVVHF